MRRRSTVSRSDRGRHSRTATGATFTRHWRRSARWRRKLVWRWCKSATGSRIDGRETGHHKPTDSKQTPSSISLSCSRDSDYSTFQKWEINRVFMDGFIDEWDYYLFTCIRFISSSSASFMLFCMCLVSKVPVRFIAMFEWPVTIRKAVTHLAIAFLTSSVSLLSKPYHCTRSMLPTLYTLHKKYVPLFLARSLTRSTINGARKLWCSKDTGHWNRQQLQYLTDVRAGMVNDEDRGSWRFPRLLFFAHHSFVFVNKHHNEHFLPNLLLIHNHEVFAQQ